MKGIVLAGGSGTRLYPITKVVSKQILPLYAVQNATLYMNNLLITAEIYHLVRLPLRYGMSDEDEER